ncbi:MAG: glycine--tRNA ligase subunit beta [Rhodobacteraceae bacterium]|nr:glycine--tRNA ligase subunit beta [Paracoccaceae bacterium]MYF45667.1 glycine--tRNA ligase subunit beta [Paracoccaceae bacterium]
MPDLLLEIYTEEIPSSIQKPQGEQLKSRVMDELKECKLEFGQSTSYSTPQRTILLIEDLPWQSAQQTIETRGPRVGAPEEAIDGFLKSKSRKIDDLETRTVGKAEYYFLTEVVPGSAVNDILQKSISFALTRMSLPKSMFWGSGRTKWVRPIQSLLGILFDKEKTEIVPFQFAGLQAGNTTCGHRFMASGELSIDSFTDYQSKLLNAFVDIDPKSRKDRILESIQSEINKGYPNLELVHDEELLEEIVGLVEWPVPIIGEIGESFQNLPEEVLKTTIKVHQKYLSVRNTNKDKITNFYAVANFLALDGGKSIIKGNQRVLASRLSDAQFFLNEDLNSLPSNLVEITEVLTKVRYSFGLGTQKDRVERIDSLAKRIAPIFSVKEKDASMAARLSKFDLVTNMVREFPELQGVMGKYYGLSKGIEPRICEAIEDHYLPAKASDNVPENPISITVGLADRINHLVGFFLRKEIPTGLGDPNALRRAALGIIRLILDNKINGFGLREIITFSVEEHFRVGNESNSNSQIELKTKTEEKEKVVEDIINFILRRYSIYLVEQGYDSEIIDACIFVPDNDDLFKIFRRIETLASFLPTTFGTDLLHLEKRISKILLTLDSGQHGKSSEITSAPIYPSLFSSSHEVSLFEKYNLTLDMVSRKEVDDLLGKLHEVSKLRTEIDNFFDNVMIGVDDQAVKNNRLNLLANIHNMLTSDFDLNLITNH